MSAQNEKAETKKTETEFSEKLVTVRIITDRGPFFQGKPLPQNAVLEMPQDLANILKSRKWAEVVKNG